MKPSEVLEQAAFGCADAWAQGDLEDSERACMVGWLWSVACDDFTAQRAEGFVRSLVEAEGERWISHVNDYMFNTPQQAADFLLEAAALAKENGE